MRLFTSIFLAAGLVAVSASTKAQDLLEALALAYSTNPQLASAQAQLRAVDEQVPLAKSGFLPNVSANASVDQTWSSTNPGVAEQRNGKNLSVSITQPLYRGGRTLAAMRQARAQVDAQRALLRSAEQSLLLQATTAYVDVVRDQAILALNINNESVLERQLEAAQDRFRVGEVTRTDVSQAESRRAGALAGRVQAAGDLQASIATFQAVMGVAPAELSQPELAVALPASREQAIEIARDLNPDLMAARAQEDAAREGIDLVFGEFLPTVNLVGTISRSFDGSTFFNRQRTDQVVAQLTVPLYQSGGVSARVRSAKQSASQALADVESTQRAVEETVIAAWEDLIASRASIEAFEAQVLASEIALEGVRQEAQVGSRTTLDILDAEQEFLNAQVDLVTAQRNEVIAVFSLLAATGQLSPQTLNLDVRVYDPTAYQERIDNRFFGTSID